MTPWHYVGCEMGCGPFGLLRQSVSLFECVTDPAAARKRQAAKRQAAYRARRGASVTVHLDPELKAAFDAYMQRQAMDGLGLTQSQVIERLLRSQLLRKR